VFLHDGGHFPQDAGALQRLDLAPQSIAIESGLDRSVDVASNGKRYLREVLAGSRTADVYQRIGDARVPGPTVVEPLMCGISWALLRSHR
jgi:hypothetical protein